MTGIQGFEESISKAPIRVSFAIFTSLLEAAQMQAIIIPFLIPYPSGIAPKMFCLTPHIL